MEVSKMITLSTAHITEETSKMLENPNNKLPLSIYNKGQFGWFIYVPTETKDDSETLKELPKDLAILYMFARYNEFEVICLDCDGDTVDKLPIYDW